MLFLHNYFFATVEDGSKVPFSPDYTNPANPVAHVEPFSTSRLYLLEIFPYHESCAAPFACSAYHLLGASLSDITGCKDPRHARFKKKRVAVLKTGRPFLLVKKFMARNDKSPFVQ